MINKGRHVTASTLLFQHIVRYLFVIFIVSVFAVKMLNGKNTKRVKCVEVYSQQFAQKVTLKPIENHHVNYCHTVCNDLQITANS